MNSMTTDELVRRAAGFAETIKAGRRTLEQVEQNVRSWTKYLTQTEIEQLLGLVRSYIK